MSYRVSARPDPDIALIAALIGDPSRALMLSALTDGRALPAGELARLAHVSPQTGSSHLDKLFKANLLSVEVQGRHHYYRLRNARVADLLEAMSIIARPVEPRTMWQREQARQLRFARTCYGHLAGQLGVAVTEALCAKNSIIEEDASYQISETGAAWFRTLGIEVDALRRKPLAKPCLDWSERRHHLAGALGVALCAKISDLGWVTRIRDSRALRLNDRGKAALNALLAIAL